VVVITFNAQRRATQLKVGGHIKTKFEVHAGAGHEIAARAAKDGGALAALDAEHVFGLMTVTTAGGDPVFLGLEIGVDIRFALAHHARAPEVRVGCHTCIQWKRNHWTQKLVLEK